MAGKTGWLASLQNNGQELLFAPVKPNFWRVPTDHDNGWKVPKLMDAWKDAVATPGALAIADEEKTKAMELIGLTCTALMPTPPPFYLKKPV